VTVLELELGCIYLFGNAGPECNSRPDSGSARERYYIFAAMAQKKADIDLTTTHYVTGDYF